MQQDHMCLALSRQHTHPAEHWLGTPSRSGHHRIPTIQSDAISVPFHRHCLLPDAMRCPIWWEILVTNRPSSVAGSGCWFTRLQCIPAGPFVAVACVPPTLRPNTGVTPRSCSCGNRCCLPPNPWPSLFGKNILKYLEASNKGVGAADGGPPWHELTPLHPHSSPLTHMNCQRGCGKSEQKHKCWAHQVTLKPPS